MPNPKRKRAMKNWQSIGNIRLRVKVKHGFQNSTLGEIEDGGARKFLVQIASKAAANAINENRAMNIPVTLMKDGWVVQIAPDGKITKLKKIDHKERVYKILTKGATLHVKGNL